MGTILLIKTGDTFSQIKDIHGDFETMIAACLPDTGPEMTVYDARDQAPLPDLSEFVGVIITGSHSMVSDQEDWSERLLPYIREMYRSDIPVLGICFGHQLIATAMGGEVAFHEKGIEAGSVEAQLTETGRQDALLGQLPDNFLVNVGHQQTVTKLPEKAVLLAENRFEPHESFRIGQAMWGIQFHPEFTQAISRQYIELFPEPIQAAGHDAQVLWDSCVETPESRSLIRRFVELAVN